MNKLLRNIIWRGQSKWSFAFAGLGFFLGFLFLLLGIQLYNKLYLNIQQEVREGKLSQHLIVHKKISAAHTLKLGDPSFRADEIENLRDQPFVENLGVFKSIRFLTIMSIERFPDLQMLLPLESIGNEFLDTVPKNWEWQEGDQVVPLMISSEFLNVYNAVMAPSMNYPRLTREMVSAFPVRLELQNKGKRMVFEGRVIGFSDRFVSVLVPDNFMDWANQKMAGLQAAPPSRLMIKVTDPGDSRLGDYLDRNDYETNRDMLRGTASSAVKALLSVLLVLGVLFVLLALIIFTMAYQLIISRARTELKLLITLGYTMPVLTRTVAGYYGPLILLISMLGLIAVALLSGLMQGYLVTQGYMMDPGLHPSVWIGWFIFNLLVTGLSILIIRRGIRGLY